MKKFYFSLFILISLYLTGCMSNAYLKVMRPADINLDPSIQRVAVINRTIPESKVVNVVEGILTGEWIGQDKQGVQNVMQGIAQILRDSPTLEVIITNEELKGSGSGGVFPSPLSWNVIEHLSRKYKVDAILSIETYDSDFVVTDGSKVVEKKNDEGVVTKTTEFFAEGVASVKLGLRLYDPKNKTIADQSHHTDDNQWRATGRSVKDALAHLIDSKAAIHEVSYGIGMFYGERISPSWITITREFYRKPKKDLYLNQGARRADVGDWEGAIVSWRKAAESRDQKIAGRGAFNAALGYEVLGQLETARQWAIKSYTDFGNKKGRNYANTLENRIWQQKKLDRQLGNL